MAFRASRSAASLLWGGLLVASLVLVVSLVSAARLKPVNASDFSQGFSGGPSSRPVEAFTFQDEAGQPLSLRDFKGRFVLLNLWATWCASCVSEMPSLAALQRHFDPSRLTVIALSVDRNGLAAVQSFYHRHGISGLAPYLDPDSLSINALNAHLLPTTLLIDAQGREIGRIKGSIDWSAQEAIASIEERMGER